jgi:hypothetical protein
METDFSSVCVCVGGGGTINGFAQRVAPDSYYLGKQKCHHAEDKIPTLSEIEGQSQLFFESPHLIFSVKMLRPFVFSPWHQTVKAMMHMSNASHFMSPALRSLHP